jgi:hypothetical protein
VKPDTVPIYVETLADHTADLIAAGVVLPEPEPDDEP